MKYKVIEESEILTVRDIRPGELFAFKVQLEPLIVRMALSTAYVGVKINNTKYYNVIVASANKFGSVGELVAISKSYEDTVVRLKAIGCPIVSLEK